MSKDTGHKLASFNRNTVNVVNLNVTKLYNMTEVSEVKKRLTYCVLLIGATLIGCGGGGSSDAPSPEVELKPMPEKLFRVLSVESSSLLDLSSELNNSGSEIVNITKVNHESVVHCSEPERTATGFIAEFEAGQLCSYIVDTINKENEKTSTQVDVFASNAESPLLPAKSDAAVITEGQTKLNIKTLLGSDWPVGYSLNHNVTVTDSANGGATGSVEGNSIDVTFGSKPSYITVVYTLTDNADSDNVMLGYIYVSVSSESAIDVAITPQVYNFTETLVLTNKYEIDLSSLPGLSIQTNGAWELDSAYGFNLGAQISGTTISVTPAKVGRHQLSYVLKNSVGSYSVGQIIFTVKFVERASSWEDLTYRLTGENIRWVSPTVPSDVDHFANVDGFWDSSAKNTIAVFTADSALSYCSRIGRLPYTEDIRTMISKSISGEVKGDPKKWPVGRNYWTINPSSLKVSAASLTNSSIVEVGDVPQYTTCITYDELIIDTLVSEITGSAPVKVGLVRTPISVSSSEYKLNLLSDTLTEEDLRLSIEAKDDNSFYVVVTRTAQGKNKSGDFRVAVDQVSPSIDTVTTMMMYLQPD